MSKLDWRNNKIHALTGDPKDDTILPTYAQYLVWQGNAERAITAVGANYLNNLIEKIEERWDGSKFPVLGPDDEVEDNHNSDDFKKAVIELASLCGRDSPHQHPTVNAAVIKINYEAIILDFASLRQQVSSAAQKHFP